LAAIIGVIHEGVGNQRMPAESAEQVDVLQLTDGNAKDNKIHVAFFDSRKQGLADRVCFEAIGVQVESGALQFGPTRGHEAMFVASHSNSKPRRGVNSGSRACIASDNLAQR
jgi:hypothetical protein